MNRSSSAQVRARKEGMAWLAATAGLTRHISCLAMLEEGTLQKRYWALSRWISLDVQIDSPSSQNHTNRAYDHLTRGTADPVDSIDS